MRFSSLICLLSLLSALGCQVKPAAAPATAEPQPSPAPQHAVRADHDHPEAARGAGLLDPANPDVSLLQRPDEALAAFPVDRYGYVDWMAALEKRLIQPRSTVRGGAEAAPLDLNIVMRNTRAMPHVVFPHRAHTQWLECGNCHPALFAEKAGTTRMLMEDIYRGRYCGTCHGSVAFSALQACERCHRLPHGDVKPWW